jgi:hypothetical protein
MFQDGISPTAVRGLRRGGQRVEEPHAGRGSRRATPTCCRPGFVKSGSTNTRTCGRSCDSLRKIRPALGLQLLVPLRTTVDAHWGSEVFPPARARSYGPVAAQTPELMVHHWSGSLAGWATGRPLYLTDLAAGSGAGDAAGIWITPKAGLSLRRERHPLRDPDMIPHLPATMVTSLPKACVIPHQISRLSTLARSRLTARELTLC